MLIGDLAVRSGVPRQTIRFYEREGVMPEPNRASNSYRNYDESALTRLRFIQAAHAAGLTLAQMKSIFDIRISGAAPCAHVAALLRQKRDDVRTWMLELENLETELSALIQRSQELDPGDCLEDAVCQIFLPNPTPYASISPGGLRKRKNLHPS